MNKYITKIAMVLAALFMAVPVFAIELDTTEIGFPIEKIEMHGFFAQGYMKSSNNSIFGESHDGTLDLRDFGVNFSGYLTEDILLAVQFMGYSLGDQGGDKINLHYGIFDYNYSDQLGFRAGRVRVPLGLYNETRDIDMLRTSIFLPQSIYPETSRDYFASTDAVSLYGGFDLDVLGFLSYQTHIGKLINDDDLTSDLTYTFRGLGFYDIHYENGNSAGAQLLWDTPLQGLRAAWSWRRIDNTAIGTVEVPGVGPLEIPITVTNHCNQVWSVEYQIDKLTLSAETSRVTIDGLPDATGWYAGANYEITEKFSLGGNYSRYAYDRGNLSGTNPDLMNGFQNTVSLYGKYNITPSWVVKAQVDMNRGTALNQNFSRSVGDELESMLFAVKTSWSF
ncbi:MAG: hypothetical protein JW745_07415 [Sedimentisphaerales bacterium]|nr:hypothetical protein [Sedimentisphaerales bacterium]MBN2841856.1 hypothetical protein [Sedimentisphaerales bacterium]